ncbi:MAG TPA: 3-deoxy-8-phosphooctulonate synthase [Nitrospirota bacterium]|nr:3-deoxy-8-phosphooctulonate synthase [Nitrospirota bacterium]
MTKGINIGGIIIGGGNPVVLIAGPCVIESEDKAMRAAEDIVRAAEEINAPLVFKASFDKANRSSASSYRGPGIRDGLKILAKVKKEYGVPVISDIHGIEQVALAAEVLDAIQIPAFLCRQTDLLAEAARTGLPVNVKKGQFMAPWDMKNVIEKIKAAGSDNIILTERGASFGYNNLVVDFRSLAIMRDMGYPVVFDATHSVQLPGGAGTKSSGQREFVRPLARAAAAVGIDGIFMEVHPCPDEALCDGPNMVDVAGMVSIYEEVRDISGTLKGRQGK